MKNVEWKQVLADYFSFSGKERWAILILVLVILVLFIAPDYFPESTEAIQEEDSLVARMAKQWKHSDSISSANKFSSFREKKRNDGISSPEKHARFYFDPNLATREDWIRLGLRHRTAETILKFRSKGGRFKNAEDLDKVFGLSPALAKELKPYVRITARSSDTSRSKPVNYKNEQFVRNRYEPAPGKATVISINKADSLDWISLPGIGPKLAGRILHFKEKLGGFYSIDQVREVFGIPDSLFIRIQPFLRIEKEDDCRQFLINTATQQELSAHPYIRWQLATAIVKYREEHGPFSKLEDLLKIHLVNEEVLKKITPYCKIR
jgi:competence protein ComEA